MNNIKIIISNELLRLNIHPKYMGFNYLRELLIILINNNNEDYKNSLSVLANLFSKTINSIEKNIANCIESSFLHSDINFLENEYGNLIDLNRGKLTNKAFIMHLYNKLITNYIRYDEYTATV